MKIPADVKTVPELIQWIADKWHEGKPKRIADRLKIPVSSVYPWVNGNSPPDDVNLAKLVQAYGLDPWEVIDIRTGKRAGVPAFPSVSRRPRVASRKGRAAAGALTALALVASGGSASASSIVPTADVGHGALCQIQRRRLGPHTPTSPTRRRALWWGRDRRLQVVPTPIFATTCA